MNYKSKIFVDSWRLAWREKPSGSILTDRDTPFYLLPEINDGWVADPFLFENDGVTYIFAEKYDYHENKGSIAYCQLVKGYFEWHTAISEETHLSFPNIFRKDNEIYMMPESSASEEIPLYRAISFPDQWEKVSTIRQNVCCVDTIFLPSGSMLTYDISCYDIPKLLYLSENATYILPFDWIEFRRPAGKVLLDVPIRPAQDCVAGYGEGLVFYWFDESGNEYSETEVQRIYPEDIKTDKTIYLNGMHTYNATDKYEIIDLKTRTFNLYSFITRTISALKRCFFK